MVSVSLAVLRTTYEKDASSEPGFRSGAAVGASAQEEQSSETNFFDVQPGEDGVESFGVIKPPGLELTSSDRISWTAR